MPLDWYLEPRGLAERNSAYLNVATQLFVEATKNALSAAKISAADVDTVVTISSSGIATPTLEARASAELGFRPNILRVPVFGLGCAGGVSGLALGSQLARANPGSVVLVLAVELCSLWFHQDTLTKANIVASALFGDGAAAGGWLGLDALFHASSAARQSGGRQPGRAVHAHQSGWANGARHGFCRALAADLFRLWLLPRCLPHRSGAGRARSAGVRSAGCWPRS